MCNRLISIVCGPAFIVAASGVAFAAPPAPAPVYSWTGWYVGGNLGASFGNAKTDFNEAPVTLSQLAVSGTFTPGFSPDTSYPSGFMGGGQIGYNWQYSPLIVVGLEADFQGALERDSINLNSPFTAPVTFSTGAVVPPATGTEVTNYTTRIDWFGTVRARVGYVWGNGDVLSYVTAGLAYGEVKINGTSTVSGTLLGEAFSITQAIGHSQVNTGWVVGYGTEGRLANSNWTWKVEGLYMDLGTVNAAGVISGTSAPPTFTVTGGQLTTHSHFTDSILRGGLNYKFY